MTRVGAQATQLVALDREVARLLRVERLDAGACVPEPIGELHDYLTAPAVMPRVRVRWKMRKNTRVGMRPSSADALVVVTSISRSPCSTVIATGTVWVVVRHQEGERDQELVPRPDEEEDEQHRQRRPRDRVDHAPEDLPAARAVERRRLEQLLRERAVAPTRAGTCRTRDWMTVKMMITAHWLS